MQLKKEQKTLILIGGANLFLTFCNGLYNAVDAIRNRNALQLFSPPSSAGALIWSIINAAMLWRFNEVGKNIRKIQNVGNSVGNTAYGVFNQGVSFAKSLIGKPSDHALPSTKELEINARVKLINLENTANNITEGGAATFDAIKSSLSI